MEGGYSLIISFFNWMLFSYEEKGGNLVIFFFGFDFFSLGVFVRDFRL